MYTYVVNHQQNYSLQNEYKKLVNSYTLLKESAKSLYNVGLSEHWEHINYLNDFAISENEEDRIFFFNYETDKKKLINIRLHQQNLKEDKIKKIFEMRNKRLTFHLDRLDEKSIGTTLNLLEEFYENVSRDIERNLITEREFITAVNNIFEYEFSSEDRNKNKKEVNYEFSK